MTAWIILHILVTGWGTGANGYYGPSGEPMVPVTFPCKREPSYVCSGFAGLPILYPSQEQCMFWAKVTQRFAPVGVSNWCFPVTVQKKMTAEDKADEELIMGLSK